MIHHEYVTDGGWRLVGLAGRMDAHTSPDIEQELLARPEAFIAIDLEHVSYMGSAGLRVILTALKACQARGGKVCLLRPNASVRDILKISGFIALFEILDSELDLSI
jgi:anti-anti-sigma factor